MKGSPSLFLGKAEIFLNFHVTHWIIIFYRKFYSTYNIFQQKGNIQEELVYTAATETYKNTGEGWKISVICWFYFTALKTRHAAGISSKRKGRDWNKTTHNEYQHQWESLVDSPNEKSPPPSGKLYMFIH